MGGGNYTKGLSTIGRFGIVIHTHKQEHGLGILIQRLEQNIVPKSLLSLTCDARRTHCIWKWISILNCRCSTLSDKSNVASSESDLLMFLESTLDTIEGPSHRWLNIETNGKKPWDRGGIFLAAINVFLQNDKISRHECSNLIDKLKFFQQRFPDLQVFGVQHRFSCCLICDVNQINNTLLKEYITFPVLVSSKDFTKVVNGAFYLLFEGFKSPISYNWTNTEMENTFTDIYAVLRRRFSENGASQLTADSSVELGLPKNSLEFVKEPEVCNLFQELLLSFPASVSADEDGKRIFVSDTNHHRIIVANTNGSILDCIGSSPGFEDGPFETAKIWRPASSIYRADQDCLYFADSENHAIRIADMGKRTIQTLYPASDISQGNAIRRFINKLMQRLHFRKMKDKDSEEVQINALRFPWHLSMTEENDLVISNKGFGDLWILNTETCEIREKFEGMEYVVELFRKKSTNKMQIADDLFDHLISKQRTLLRLHQDFSVLDLVSSIAKLQNMIVLVDTDGQRILKFQLETGDISSIQLSNLGCLGFPYWWPCAVEQIFDCRNIMHNYVDKSPRQSFFQRFHVQPGRCEIGVNLIMPKGTKLVASLDEGCVWRQSRGCVVELSMYDGMLLSDKIGVEQQFYDELDDVLLAPDSSEEDDLENGDQEFKDLGTYVHSSLDVSLGVGEIIMDVVVYLALDNPTSYTEDPTSNTDNIVNVLVKSQSDEKGMCLSLLSESCKEQQNLVFMKHVHIRIRLKCSDDATAQKKLFVNFEL